MESITRGATSPVYLVGVTFLIAATVLLGLLSVGYGGRADRPDDAAAGSRETGEKVTAPIVRSPIYFEQNTGQLDDRVVFFARGTGRTLFLTSSETVISVGPGALRMRYGGASPRPSVNGLDPVPGKTHYLIGSDRERWQTGIPHLRRIQYAQLYPGIDLEFHGSGGTLEFDFLVGPGADPDAIRLAFDGAHGLRIAPSGDLVVTIADGFEPGSGEGPVLVDSAPINGADRGGSVTFRAPTVYQELAGERRMIPGEFRKLGTLEAGFRVGPYDKTLPLVIDPVIAFSTYIGGEDNEDANDVAIDGDGNAYIVGTTKSISYPISSPASPRARASLDVYVTKMHVESATLVYTLFIGTGDDDRGHAVAVDNVGHAYITGATRSNIFPTVDPVQSIWGGGYDAFVAKLSLDGASLLYSTYLGGAADDSATDIALDGAGNTYLVGQSASSDFPTKDAIQADVGGNNDVFVTKLDPTGSALVFSTYLGGTEYDVGRGIDITTAGEVYLTGLSASTDFPTLGSLYPAPSTGDSHAIVSRLNAAGATLVYSTYLGGGGIDTGSGIAVDVAGNAYVVGKTESTDFPTTPGAPQNATGGGTDAFASKLTPTGGALSYSTYVGGDSYDEAYDVAIDSDGNAFFTGRTASTSFPTLSPLQPTLAGFDDAFVAALAIDGQGLFSTYLGGDQIDEGRALILDADGHIYVTGNTDSTTFPTARPYDGSVNGMRDAFLVKLEQPLDFWMASIEDGPAVPIATEARPPGQ
jgi:hypothetical protein